MSKTDEVKVCDLWITCPETKMNESLGWTSFCAGLGWTGDPVTKKVQGVCVFECPGCGLEHTITLPENT